MRRLLLAATLGVLAGCARQERLPDYGQVPDFHLTSQDGAEFDSKVLRGHVWVADFIFTNCEGPCPRMSSKMRALQSATATTPEFKLVSFTVDPARDTPLVLAQYARHFGADRNRWFFLTGNPATLQMLDRDAFKLGNLSSSMDHSTRFVLVDGRGRIRGYYGIAQGDPMGRIGADAHVLEREHSS